MKIDITANADATVTLYAAGKKVWRGPVSGLGEHLPGLAMQAQATKKPKKQKPKSRSVRWSDACSAATAALEELVDIQQEFSDWKDNLPENLQQSTLGEKLETVCDIDLQSALDAAGEAEGADLPLGFGRD